MDMPGTGHPVIAAVRDEESVHRAAESRVSTVFILGGDILTLPDMVARLRGHQKRVFVHIDLCEGLGRDNAAVEWCVRVAGPHGIISTRAPLLKRAKELGAHTIQRMFLVDSASFERGIQLLSKSPPDMVELLPGLVPKAIAQLSQRLAVPVIAGGMITRADEVQRAIEAGARGVSTSEASLW